VRRLLPLALLLVGAAPAPRCDDGCLHGLADRFVAALAQRGASARLPWAQPVRYAENGVSMMVDDGIWATVTAPGARPLVLADAAAGEVVWMGAIEEHGQPSFLALRLKAAGNRIAEGEAVIRRKEGRPPFADPKAIDFTDGLAAGQRTPRARLEAAARGWFAGQARTAPDCRRTENGVAGGCTAPATEAVRGLSFPVTDEARGLVVAVATRDHPGRAGGDTPFPHSYATVTVFQMGQGGIARVMEVSSSVPYLMPTWGARR